MDGFCKGLLEIQVLDWERENKTPGPAVLPVDVVVGNAACLILSVCKLGNETPEDTVDKPETGGQLLPSGASVHNLPLLIVFAGLWPRASRGGCRAAIGHGMVPSCPLLWKMSDMKTLSNTPLFFCA